MEAALRAADIADLQERMLHTYGIRVGHEMGRYVLSRMDGRRLSELPVIGGDARTGRPRRITIDPEKLLGPPPA